MSRGFKQSKIDPYLFLKKDVILVMYVDDCLLFACKLETLDILITSLQQEFTLTDEGDVGAFLGLDIKQNEKGQLELMQPGLIRKIIAEFGLLQERLSGSTEQ